MTKSMKENKQQQQQQQIKRIPKPKHKHKLGSPVDLRVIIDRPQRLELIKFCEDLSVSINSIITCPALVRYLLQKFTKIEFDNEEYNIIDKTFERKKVAEIRQLNNKAMEWLREFKK